MPRHSAGWNDLVRARETRRWTPQFGYGLMVGGAALFWGLAGIAVSVLV